MSSEKVKKFLEEKELSERQEKEKEMNLTQLRYEVLNHYNLGEIVIYKEGDRIEDFPLTRKRSVGRSLITERFRYDCDISDEDFEKILEIYNQEVGVTEESETKINDGAEKILGVYAVVALIVGIIAFFVCFIVAFSIEEWSLIGTGLGVFLATLVGFAFIKVFVNISYKLDNLRK